MSPGEIDGPIAFSRQQPALLILVEQGQPDRGGQLRAPVFELSDQREGMANGPGHGQTLDLDEGGPVRAVGGQLAVTVGQGHPGGVEQSADYRLADAVGGGEDPVVAQGIVGRAPIGAGHPQGGAGIEVRLLFGGSRSWHAGKLYPGRGRAAGTVGQGGHGAD